MAKNVMGNGKAVAPTSLGGWAFFNFYRTAFLCASIGARAAAAFLPDRVSRRVAQGSAALLGHVEPINKKPVIWVHGVSMGESLVASAIAVELRQQYPSHGIVFTTTHPDVLAAIQQKNIADVTSYFPLDSYLSMNKAFNVWQPSLVIVAETDFWPEFSYQCRSRKIPLVLVNGRVSTKIASFYGMCTGLGSVIFSAYSKLLVQSMADADRLCKCGANRADIEVLGNVKADLLGHSDCEVSQEITTWAVGSKLIVFGSLHPLEFENLFPAILALHNSGHKILIAPRNLKNSELWKQRLVESGIKTELRSALSSSGCDAHALILDSMGELSAVYSIASAAFVGGTLDDRVGGHNPLEVVQQRIPLLMGPFYRNFTDIVDQLKAADAIYICAGAEDLAANIAAILTDSDLATRRVNSAYGVLKANQGALKKTMQIIRSVYSQSLARNL